MRRERELGRTRDGKGFDRERCGQRRDKETRPGVCEWAADGDGAWCEVEIRVYFKASEDCRAQVMTNRGQEGSQTQAAATMVENGEGWQGWERFARLEADGTSKERNPGDGRWKMEAEDEGY